MTKQPIFSMAVLCLCLLLVIFWLSGCAILQDGIGNGDQSVVTQSPMEINPELDRFFDLIIVFEATWHSFEAIQDSSVREAVATSPWIDHNNFSLSDEDLSLYKQLSFTESVEIEKGRLDKVSENAMQGTACIMRMDKAWEIETETLGESTVFRSCYVYKFRLVDGRWLLSSLFLVDARAGSYIDRDWRHAPVWMKEELGALPDDLFLYVNGFE